MEPPPKIRRGIRWKLLVTMLGLIVGLLAVLSWIEIRESQQLIERETEKRVKLMHDVLVARGEGAASQLAKEVGNHITGGAFSAVSDVVTNATRLDAQLSYAIVLNKEAQALVHVGERGALVHDLIRDGELKQYTGEDDRYAARQTNNVPRDVFVNGTEVLEVIAPVFNGNERWGVLRLGYSLASLRNEIAKSRRETNNQVRAVITRSVATAVGMVLLGMIVVAWISALISKPLQRVTESARQLATGDFSAASKLDIRSQDEVGVLADAFTKMADNLRRSYAQLEEYNRDLALKVEERTRDLAKMTVAAEEARKSAEGANSAKSSFLASMSHELRTPLTSIIGFSELLYSDAEAEGRTEAMEDITRVMDSAKHLLGLINDILDLSKVEAQKMELHLERFEVAQLIKDVASTIAPLAAKRGNTLVVDAAPDIGTMTADLVKLRQSLLNLMSNANKFTEKGELRVTARRVARHEGDFISLAISDSGIGMTPGQLAKLFQAFQQADSSTSRKFGGTGLGLVITKKFCELMGGSVEVRSEIGKGSTFEMHIPAEVRKPGAKPAEPPAPSATPKLSEAVAPLLPGFAAKPDCPVVLVVDDDTNVHRLVEKALRDSPCTLRFASNGREAIELARQIHPAVITLDVDMPVKDGWSTLKELKSDPALAAIPVVMMTMSTTDSRLGYTLGAAEFLPKPVEAATLARVLHNHTCRAIDGHVLLVEDDATLRQMMRRMLEAEKIAVVEAENGVRALELLKHARPSFILLDLNMPVMDGFSFLREFRQHPEWEDIPVVVLTARMLDEQEHEFLVETSRGILQKGDRVRADLVHTVQHYLHDHPPAGIPAKAEETATS